MIGKCPLCGISLDKPPFNDRERSEVILILKYRKIIENNIQIKTIEELGFCELCNARENDLKKQKGLRQKIKAV